jgi:hypothetical protein
MQLIEFGLEEDLIALVRPSAKTLAAAQKVADRIPEPRQPAGAVRIRPKRHQGPATGKRGRHGNAAV